MKHLILIILFLISINSKAQTQDELINLKSKASELEQTIKAFQDTLNSVNSKIRKIEHHKIKNENIRNSNNPIYGHVFRSCDVKESEKHNSKTLLHLSPNDSIILLGYNAGNWIVNLDSTLGYLSSAYILDTKLTKEFKQKLRANNERKKLEKKRIQQEKEEQLYAYKLKQEQIREAAKHKLYRAELNKKYGVEIANRLLLDEYWIGMTKDMARVSLGAPNKINKSVGSWGVHEQWVYKNLYIYFENGKLSSYQKTE